MNNMGLFYRETQGLPLKTCADKGSLTSFLGQRTEDGRWVKAGTAMFSLTAGVSAGVSGLLPTCGLDFSRVGAGSQHFQRPPSGLRLTIVPTVLGLSGLGRWFS